MKSLRDEIRLRRVKEDGFNFTKAIGFDFIQTQFGFHIEQGEIFHLNVKSTRTPSGHEPYVRKLVQGEQDSLREDKAVLRGYSRAA